MNVLDAYPWVAEKFQLVREGDRANYVRAFCALKCHRSGPALKLWLGTDGRLMFGCHTGCDKLEILRAVSAGWKDCFPADTDWKRVRQEEVARYSYHNEAGALLYQTVRLEPGYGGADKTFRQRTSLGNGRWAWGLKEGWYVPSRADSTRLYAGREGEAGAIWVPAPRRVLYRLFDVVTAPPGEPVVVCYSDDTEILTPGGWVPFPDLTPDHSVAQYDWPTAEISFARPLAVQKFDYAGPMVNIRADFSDLLVTPDHRVLIRRKRCLDRVVRAEEVRKSSYLPVSGVHSTGAGHGPTPSEVRMLAAFAADATVCRGHHLTWNLKKARKKDRLRQLLSDAGVRWEEKVYPSAPGWTMFDIDRREAEFLLRYFPDKAVHLGCLDWPYQTRCLLLEELAFWDGSPSGSRGGRYYTSKRCEADAVSAIAALTGYGCILRTSDRPERPESSTEYVVNLLREAQWRVLGHDPIWTAGYSGHVYCCTVPTGFVVVRRNGKVTIAGNCAGEKDVDSLRAVGVLATTNVCGESAEWLDSYSDALAGRDVVVVEDRDSAGRRHANEVVGSLTDRGAASVRRVRLPTKDATAYLNGLRRAGMTDRDELKAELSAVLGTGRRWEAVAG